MAQWRESTAPWPGHNPLGGLSVVGLIIVMGVQVVLGLFSVDVDGLESGPLASYVSFEVGRTAAKAHALSFNFLLLLICLHLVAVIYYIVFKRHELIRPMVSGRRAKGQHVTNLHFAPLWRVIPGAAFAAVVVWLIAVGFQL
jgi:cytochrome b